MAYIEIDYKCPGCGYEDSQTVETYYLIEPMRCPKCDQVMVETSREQEPKEDEY
jgi:predicted Zn-ribbon and HTH transcriptional regulator